MKAVVIVSDFDVPLGGLLDLSEESFALLAGRVPPPVAAVGTPEATAAAFAQFSDSELAVVVTTRGGDPEGMTRAELVAAAGVR